VAEKTEMLALLKPSEKGEQTVQAGGAPEIGQWYWISEEPDHEHKESWRWLGCVTRIGSNYVKLKGPAERHTGELTTRIHFDEFWEKCERVPDPDSIINSNILSHKAEAERLMLEVQQVTAMLGVTPKKAIAGVDPSSETQALSLRSSEPVKTYKKALIKAKEKTLPDLFEKIEAENSAMGSWMKAKLIPLKAEAGTLKGTISRVEDRIFSVELYAGLVEEAEKVRDGAPADNDTQLHLMQRRCYMDEECLAGYEAGGMDYRNLKQFEKWLCKPTNLARIFPFPRCVVAFRIRRDRKERESLNFLQILNNLAEEKADKATFLYVRNGQQLWRMETEVVFEEQLFPDFDSSILKRGKLWAKNFGRDGNMGDLITDDDYKSRIEEERLEDEEIKKLPRKEQFWKRRSFNTVEIYMPFTPDNVYYDDIMKTIESEQKKHNRLVLVLQGMLDRSSMLRPHPPWQLWTPEGFKAGIKLIFDDSRTLSAGDKPDFEAYRARCNAHLRTGSLTVGQEDVWEIREAERENKRLANDYRMRGNYHEHTRYRPSGDPGPGRLATVARYNASKGACTYVWKRDRRRASWRNTDKGDIDGHLTTGEENILNVDAYKPGDFHLFFDDPRTRMEYLRWAPLLIEAEECHAGNRKQWKPNPVTLLEAPRKPVVRGHERPVDLSPPAEPKKKPLIGDRWRGKLVSLKWTTETKGGMKFEAGEILKVTSYDRKMLSLEDLKKRERCIRRVEISSVTIVGDAPSDESD
jgi:hypothetical protein